MTFLCTGSYSVSTVEVLLFITTFVPDHRRNLDNNMGERQNRPWVLEILSYEAVKRKKSKAEVHPCTDTEALYRSYDT